MSIKFQLNSACGQIYIHVMSTNKYDSYLLHSFCASHHAKYEVKSELLRFKSLQ